MVYVCRLGIRCERGIGTRFPECEGIEPEIPEHTAFVWYECAREEPNGCSATAYEFRSYVFLFAYSEKTEFPSASI